jgi:hypothetical protein
VIRLRPPTAWPGLLRWLTVVLTLAGLGVLQSGHCDDSPVAVTSQSSAGCHLEATIVAEATTPAATDHHHDHHGTPGRPAATDECTPLTITVAAAPTVAALRTEPPLRAVAVITAFRPPLPPGRTVPRVALDALGVSRT